MQFTTAVFSGVKFLPRDAMHQRGLCRHAVSVCLCVCLSVTFVDHVKTNKHIFKLFTHSDSPTNLVFPYQTGWRYSDGNPPDADVECRWGRQITRFWTNTGFPAYRSTVLSTVYESRTVKNKAATDGGER